jgi:hypothetical protein
MAEVPQGSMFASVLCSIYINDAPIAPGTHLALFVDDTCIYATENMSVLFSTNSNVISLLWGHGVSARTLQSMKGTLRQSTSLEDIEYLRMNSN